MIRSAVLLAASFFAVPAAVSTASAQTDPFAPPPLHVLEVTTRSRWLHEAQHPASVRFTMGMDRFDVRVRPPRARLDYWGYQVDGQRIEGYVGADSRNAPSSLTVRPPAERYDGDLADGVDGVRPAGRNLLSPQAGLGLPATRLWELPVPLPGGEITPGLAWTDTVRIESESGRWSGERVRIAWDLRADGDTLLKGRRLPVVRVDGVVDYSSVEPVPDAARERPLLVERRGEGRIRGRVVVDTAVGLRAAGADTLVLEGASTLVLQDGRRFTEPARFERMRSFALRDSAEWEAEQDRRRSDSRRTSGGMLIPPREDAEAPLTVDSDSLWTAWAAAVDPEERRRAESMLWRAAELPRAVLNATLRRSSLAAGDSSAVLQGLADGHRVTEPLTGARWREVALFLHDPGRLWRWGIVPRWSYSELIAAVREDNPTGSGSGCVPADCEAILADMEASPEPRLREVALVARFHRDPAAYWDPLLALRDSGSTLADRAIALGRGVGATWPAAPKAPMPDAGADWRAWLAWMGGEVRLGSTHAAALRVYRQRTARDPLDDLETRWPDLESDSARLVVGAILRFADRLAPPTPSELHADLLSESAAAAAAARRELRRLLSVADTVPAADALPFLGPVLDSILAVGRPPWPRAPRLEYDTALGQGFHGALEAPVFVSDGYLPRGLPAGRAVTAVDSATWAGRDRRAAGVLVEFSPVRRLGDLVHLDWSWTAWFEREPDETPVGYAGGESLWLARTDDGWVVVESGAWIT